MVGSDTDDSISICDIGDVQTPTFENYEASLDGFRDEDPDFDGYYNLFFRLFTGIDRPYILLKPIVRDQTEPAQPGDTASMHEALTDNPTDLPGDHEMIRLCARL